MRGLIVLAGLAVVGCGDSAAETFGRTYDECVLKNVKGAIAATAQIALKSCERRFARPSTAEIAATGHYDPANSRFLFHALNERPVIVTQVRFVVSYYRSPADQQTGKTLTSHAWEYPAHIDPSSQEEFGGSIGDAWLPSKTFTVKAISTAEIPLAQ